MTTTHTRYAFNDTSWFCSTHDVFEPRVQGVHYSEIEEIVNSLDLFNLDTDKVATVREFISALLVNLQKRDSYLVPAVSGIAKIEDDFTFIQWVHTTRELLWN